MAGANRQPAASLDLFPHEMFLAETFQRGDLPVLGPLSGLINNVLPGAGYNMARHGTATVRVKNGEIETDDLKIAGSGFEMLGNGKLFFVDDRMDFTIRVDAQGVPGAILSPVSRLFEYTAQSSLSKPVWKPKRLPSL